MGTARCALADLCSRRLTRYEYAGRGARGVQIMLDTRAGFTLSYASCSYVSGGGSMAHVPTVSHAFPTGDSVIFPDKVVRRSVVQMPRRATSRHEFQPPRRFAVALGNGICATARTAGDLERKPERSPEWPKQPAGVGPLRSVDGLNAAFAGGEKVTVTEKMAADGAAAA